MVARLTVTPKATVTPARSERVQAPKRLTGTRTVRVTATRPGTARLTVALSGQTFATGRTTFTKAGTRGVALRLTTAGRERLEQSPTSRGQLVTRITSRDGKASTFTQPVTLAR